MTDGDPRTPAEWNAYRALPEWEVTAHLTRTARFRVHAASPGEARERVERSGNGVRCMQDLYDPGELKLEEIISVRKPAEDEEGT